MQETNFTVYRGDTFSEQFIFEDTDNVAIDITGWTLFFTIKKNKSDGDSDAVISKTITSIPSPELGIYTLTIPASEMNDLVGMYYYDCQMKTADGNVYTIIEGAIGTKSVYWIPLGS